VGGEGRGGGASDGRIRSEWKKAGGFGKERQDGRPKHEREWGHIG